MTLAQSDAQLDARIRLATMLRPSVWFTLHGHIVPRGGGRPIRAGKANAVQRKMFDAYEDRASKNLPCKMLVLKPRKAGASTGAQAICYHHNRKHAGIRGAIMGDIEKTSITMMRMYRTFAEKDTFDWEQGKLDPNLLKAGSITLPNGTSYGMETAGSSNAGRGDTVQVANATEVAHFPKTDTSDPALAFLNSWSDQYAQSLGIFDSTPNGPTGLFYNLWTKKDNGWIKIFLPWFEEGEYQTPFAHPQEREEFGAKLEDHEREEIARYSVTLEQLKWRRNIIETKCEGDPDKFKQEYPSNDIECFLRSSNLRFRSVVIDQVIKSCRPPSIRGELTMLDDQQVAFQPDPETGSVRIWDEPKVGLRYLVSMDTCTGEDQQVAGPDADPDYHSIGVIRAAYTSPTGEKFAPKLVAHHYSRLDTDLAALIAACMSIYYGRCMVIPEVNNCGLTVVKRLEEWGIPVYQRVTTNTTAGTRDKFSGWRTDGVTRKSIIDDLAANLREWKTEAPTIEIPCEWIAKQLSKFIITSSGRAQAMPGEHDDGVMMAAIGFYRYNLDYASVMKEPKVRRLSVDKINRRQGWRAS